MTGLQRIVDAFDTALRWLVRLTWLNLWWLMLTLLGGIVLGWAPATVAAHAVANQWLDRRTRRAQDKDVSVSQQMWLHWRRHWVRANGASMVCTALAVSLLATRWLSGHGDNPADAVAQAVSLVALVLTAVMACNLAWTTLQMPDQPITSILLGSLGLGLARPFLTVVAVLAVVGWPTVLVVSGWPGLLPVLGVSPVVVALTWCSRQATRRTGMLHPRRTDPSSPLSTSGMSREGGVPAHH